MTGSEYRMKLEQKRGKLNSLKSQLTSNEKSLEEVIVNTIDTEKALAFIQRVASATQKQIKIHIEDIITMAMASVIDDQDYEFELDFVIRNNKTEADCYFTSNGERFKPLDETGGGVVDIASFAARIALWSLGSTSNTLVFDEPFRFVSREYQSKAGDILKKLSEQLTLQILMVSHNDNFIQKSRNIITIKKVNDESIIKQEVLA